MEKIDIELGKVGKPFDKLNRSETNIKPNFDLTLNEEKGILNDKEKKLDKAEKQNKNSNSLNLSETFSPRRRVSHLRRSYTTKNAELDIKDDREREELLVKNKTKNNAEIIEERRNVNKSFINFLTLFHSALFIAIIVLQFEVNLRFNIRSALNVYFKQIFVSENEKDFEKNFPLTVFNRLAELIQNNTFWFYDKKFEIVSNVRINQRLVKNDNYTSLNLILSDEIINELNQNNYLNSYEIDPFSGFQEKYESKADLPNGQKYQTKNSIDKIYN